MKSSLVRGLEEPLAFFLIRLEFNTYDLVLIA